MAPEVIQVGEYDGRADVWSLGITAIELAQGQPPLHTMHPFRAIFTIPKSDPPRLEKQDLWSESFHDFITKCLVKDPAQRATAETLLTHQFVERGRSVSHLLADLAKENMELVRNWRVQVRFCAREITTRPWQSYIGHHMI
jgi:serine/threonine protein kinase